jgi:hypothetical protein
MNGPSKWTAFALSACVPGAGQLAARSVSSLGWFAAAGLFVAIGVWAGRLGHWPGWLGVLQVGAGVALSLLSAEHAKRLLERRQGQRARVVGSRVTCGDGKGRSVQAVIALDVAMRPTELWAIIRDLPTFLTIDPFHDRVTLMRTHPEMGVDLALSHNAFGRRFLRFGRIIAWREGVGYTFSDLSARGPRHGFPHVFIVQIEPPACQCAAISRMTIRVRGRWTSRLTPVWLGRAWIWLVCREHARLLRKGL